MCLQSNVLTESALSHPDEPGVDGAEHGTVRHDGLVDLVHVVHQPAKFHRAEISANGESCFMLHVDNKINLTL